MSVSNLPDNLGSEHGDSSPSEVGGNDPGEALAKFDFSHTDLSSHAEFGSQGLDHSDTHAALAAMSPDDALDYAISQLSIADHLDVGHLDAPVDTSHDS
ncbi:hypothetical protein [Bradyrhizobium sp. DASA03120]|uniref:hypothetical protein n=1 Tax=Bradyrhizobium sp. SMVTL-02 TaxID=3395917 RepID=UPI003F6E97F0